MKTSTYLKVTIIGTLALLIGFATVNIYIDPLFHFHDRTKGIEYPLWDERYMNDGIVRHFDYNAILTGTSMSENFKTSIFDERFGTKSIKVPFSGGTYKEVNDLLKQAYHQKKNLLYVVRTIDPTMLIMEKDDMDYTDYPDYLYDHNPFNDVNYVLNKEIFFKFTEYVHTFMSLGGKSTDFDTYKNWSYTYPCDGNAVYNEHVRRKVKEQRILTDEDVRLMMGNLEQNVVRLAVEHPETQFYLVVPPYSICYFDDLYRSGELEYTFDAWEEAYRYLISYNNINLFAYYNETAIIEELGLYKDKLHYGQNVSDLLIESLAINLDKITNDTIDDYMSFIRDYYTNFDYDSYFSGCEEEE